MKHVVAWDATGRHADSNLAQGRTPAPDYEEIEPVPMRDLAAVLRHLRTPVDVAAMIRLQYYCGARPSEICRMMGEEIDQAGIVHLKKRKVQLPGGVWVFQPGRFKQKHTGTVVAYILGKRAREIVKQYLAPGFLFPGKHGPHRTILSYQRAIRKACERSGAAH
jgi:integrase